MGLHPRTQRIIHGIVQFKHHHPRYLKPPLLANRVPRYGCLGRQPRIQTIFFGTMQFKRPHPRYPKKSLLASRVPRYGCLGRPPEPIQCFLALCRSDTLILGIQKRLCWPIGYRGMVVWGATPEYEDFGHCAVQILPSQVFKNTFSDLEGTVVGVFLAPPQDLKNNFWHCAVQIPPS